MLEIGSYIGEKYKILNVIGRGGMSTVYLAMNERANKQWAVKEVRREGVENYEIIRQSLIRETEMLKELKHENLPSIVDVLDEGDSILVVMDYIEGVTLDQVLKESGAQSEKDVMDWAVQLCNVFMYLHSQSMPIIYRDLKPANIMLKPDGKIVLIDFGTARYYKSGATHDTTTLGTKGYAAPEQFGGWGQTDVRTDIYCLGKTLHHLVTGHDPCEPPYEIYPIRHWDASLSEGFEKIIEKCTQANPDKRYQSCSEVLAALNHSAELDHNYRHELKINAIIFVVTASLAAVCLVASVGFNAMAGALEDRGYLSYIEEAKGELTKEEQINTFVKAIMMNPTSSTAYLELLNSIFLENGDYEPDEDLALRQILLTEWTDGKTLEEKLSEKPEEYAEFAYRLGLDYYYAYDGTGNKQMALKWLKIAADSKSLDDVSRSRAEKLSKIAGYYQKLGQVDYTGDSEDGYKNLWEDMTEVASGDIVKGDNATTAIMIYRELVHQIYANALHFRNAGVEYDEMSGWLTHIKKVIEIEIDESKENNPEQIKSLKETLSDDMLYAWKSLNNAFSESAAVTTESADEISK
ncbi:MAG: serine/threonine protein kinase [Lachnospiraceae bacterium]|nr:serine/threonine protein kinase [Lachnospiraceae bacterium]